MIDKEIVKLYNSIKDPTWPCIDSYYDFTKLPDSIKQECKTAHGFDQRKQEICDIDHWIGLGMKVFVKDNLAFVPVQKCASTYYTVIFSKLGWDEVCLNDLDPGVHIFGVLLHPLQRRAKGISQWIANSHVIVPGHIDWDNIDLLLKQRYFGRLISTVVAVEGHSLPYTTLFGSWLEKINWIPMDYLSDNEIKQSMMNFFQIHGHKIDLPLNDKRIHPSSEQQRNLHKFVMEQLQKDHTTNYLVMKTYSNDLKFYYNLLDNFDPTWSNLSGNLKI